MRRMENEENTQNAPEASASSDESMPALDVVLASASPRRKQLLADAGVRFVVHASDVDETLEPDLLADPPEACKKLAERKAGAVVQEVLAVTDSKMDIRAKAVLRILEAVVVRGADQTLKPTEPVEVVALGLYY